MEIIQVSAAAPASSVARAISSVVHEYHCAEVQAIGPEAVQCAEQAVSLASGYLQHEGICVDCVSKSKEVIVDNKNTTLIKLMVRVTSTPMKAKDLPRA